MPRSNGAGQGRRYRTRFANFQAEPRLHRPMAGVAQEQLLVLGGRVGLLPGVAADRHCIEPRRALELSGFMGDLAFQRKRQSWRSCWVELVVAGLDLIEEGRVSARNVVGGDDDERTTIAERICHLRHSARSPFPGVHLSSGSTRVKKSRSSAKVGSRCANSVGRIHRASLTSAASRWRSPGPARASHQYRWNWPSSVSHSQTLAIGVAARPTSSSTSRTTAASWLSLALIRPLRGVQ
jgi:hypothetical protein